MLHFENCIEGSEKEIFEMPCLIHPVTQMTSGLIQEIMKFIKNKPAIKILKIYELGCTPELFEGLHNSGELKNLTGIILNLNQVSNKEIQGLAYAKLPNLTSLHLNKTGLEGLTALVESVKDFPKLTSIYIEGNNDEILQGIIPILKAFPNLLTLDVKYAKSAQRQHQDAEQELAAYCFENNMLNLLTLEPPLYASDNYADIPPSIMVNYTDWSVPSYGE